jgi:hypothetical protein
MSDAPYGRDYLGRPRLVPHPNDINNTGKPMIKKCQYCPSVLPKWVITWHKGPFGKPGPVRVPYCGKCEIRQALLDRGMSAPVVEGVDYTINPAPEPS